MRSRRKGFLFIGIGILFLMFNVTAQYYWFKIHFTVDLIPDPVGYILIGVGLFILGTAEKRYRTGGLFALAGFILSVLGMWNYSSGQTQIILKILSAVTSTGMFWCYLSGMQKTADKAGEALLYGRARLMRVVYLLACGISAFFSYRYIAAAPLEPGAAVSLLVIIFGILIMVLEAYILYLSFAAFRRLEPALKKQWEEKF